MTSSKLSCRTDYIIGSLSVIDYQLSNQIKHVVIHKNSHDEEIFLITCADDVYGFGRNIYGRLGFGHDENVIVPTIIPELCGKLVCEIKCGESFSLALTQSGCLYTFGKDCMSGRGESWALLKPNEVSIDNQMISAIDCTNNSTHILTKTGQLYWFGYFKCKTNHFQNKQTREYFPTKTDISTNFKILSISCGEDHVLALTSNGKVFSWGENSASQLGLGHKVSILKPQLIELNENIFIKRISCGSSQSLLLTSDGQIYSFGGYICEPQLFDIKLRFRDIYCFRDISMAIDEKDRVNVWGDYKSYLKLIKPELPEFNFEIIKSPKLTKFKSYQELVNELDCVCSLKPLKQYEIFKKNPLENISETISYFFNNPKNNDLKFKITSRGCCDKYEYIYCHKRILEESSEYFKTMFASNWSEKETNEIEITGYSYEAYYHYIRCFYVQFFQTEDFALLLEILSITEQYLDSDKKNKCEDQIKSLTNLQNVCSVFSCAIKYSSDHLRQFSFDIILENKFELVNTVGYEKMDPIYIKELLNDLLSIES